MSMSINFTDAACDYIKKMLAKQSGAGFRLSIKKTGCSGYSYLPLIISEVNANDVLIEKMGIKIYIDAAWLHLLKDLTVDYIEEVKTGLKQKKLVFTNPKESNRCGCGESFHIENETL